MCVKLCIDLVEEREMLSSVTQTEVERVCDKYGIACHFVDLRLGADRLAGDAEATRVIQHEIAQSRKRSLGATFIVSLVRASISFTVEILTEM